MKELQKSKKGLCLIESVLVIAIICILVSVMLWNFKEILGLLDINIL